MTYLEKVSPIVIVGLSLQDQMRQASMQERQKSDETVGKTDTAPRSDPPPEAAPDDLGDSG